MTNEPLPPDHSHVLGALEGVTDGVAVKTLATETDLPEHTVRRCLTALMRLGLVKRKKGLPAAPNSKPPYVYTKVQKDEEVPTMPGINQVEEEEEVEVEVEVEDGGEESGYRVPSLPGAQPKTKTALGSGARGVMETMQKREVMEAELHTARVTGHKTGGTRRIERIDPIPAGFPDEEKGFLGHPVELAIVGDINDYISETYGGGSYLVHPCDHTGEAYGGRPVRVSIAGIPKPQTDEGRVWLEDRKTRLAKASGGGQGGQEMGGLPMMQYMDRVAKEARREAEESTNRMLTLFRPTGPDAKELEALRQQHQTYIDGLKTSHTTEMTLVRSDADRRVQDAGRAFEMQVTTLKEQAAALRVELKEARDKAATDLKDQRQDLDKAHDKAMAELKDRYKEQMAALEKATTEKLQWIEKMGKLESQMAIDKAKPQDFQSKVQSHMAADMAKVVLAQARKAAGLGDDEEPESMMETLQGALKEAGPEVLKRVANGIMTLVEKKQGLPSPVQRPAPRLAPPAPTRPGARPGPRPNPAPAPVGPAGPNSLLRERGAPAAPPPPRPVPPAEMTEEEQAAYLIQQASLPHLPPPIEEVPEEGPLPEEEPEVTMTPAQQATAARLKAFFEVLLTEMQIDSDAAEVWAIPLAGSDMTVEDLYFKLPGVARKAMQDAAPSTAYDTLLAAIGVTSEDDPILQAIQDFREANLSSEVWLGEFFAAGPWNETEDEEGEDEAEDEGDGGEDAPAAPETPASV